MWVAITEEDVLTVLTGPELTGYRNAARAQGQVDPVQPTIDQVTDLVRGYVGGCKANTLGIGNTIPEKLMQAACDLIAVRIPSRVKKDPTESRRRAGEQAVRLLEQVARCEFVIEEPTTPTDEVSSGQTPSICARRKTYTPRNEDGI